MKIYTDTPEGVTVVQNSFIDQFMPRANGEFVKVYLYLLRCANTGQELSLSSIADVLEHTEKDIRRALSYWEKQDLIHLKANPQGEILSITFADYTDAAPVSADTQEPSPESKAESASQSTQEAQPALPPEYEMVQARHWYTRGSEDQEAARAAQKRDESLWQNAPAAPSREKIAALSQQKELRQIFFIAE